MIDYIALMRAMSAVPLAKLPTKISGGDLPNKGIYQWLCYLKNLTIYRNSKYKSSLSTMFCSGEIEN